MNRQFLLLLLCVFFTLLLAAAASSTLAFTISGCPTGQVIVDGSSGIATSEDVRIGSALTNCDIIIRDIPELNQVTCGAITLTNCSLTVENVKATAATAALRLKDCTLDEMRYIVVDKVVADPPAATAAIAVARFDTKIHGISSTNDFFISITNCEIIGASSGATSAQYIIASFVGSSGMRRVTIVGNKITRTVFGSTGIETSGGDIGFYIASVTGEQLRGFTLGDELATFEITNNLIAPTGDIRSGKLLIAQILSNFRGVQGFSLFNVSSNTIRFAGSNMVADDALRVAIIVNGGSGPISALNSYTGLKSFVVANNAVLFPTGKYVNTGSTTSRCYFGVVYSQRAIRDFDTFDIKINMVDFASGSSTAGSSTSATRDENMFFVFRLDTGSSGLAGPTGSPAFLTVAENTVRIGSFTTSSTATNHKIELFVFYSAGSGVNLGGNGVLRVISNSFVITGSVNCQQYVNFHVWLGMSTLNGQLDEVRFSRNVLDVQAPGGMLESRGSGKVQEAKAIWFASTVKTRLLILTENKFVGAGKLKAVDAEAKPQMFFFSGSIEGGGGSVHVELMNVSGNEMSVSAEGGDSDISGSGGRAVFYRMLVMEDVVRTRRLIFNNNRFGSHSSAASSRTTVTALTSARRKRVSITFVIAETTTKDIFVTELLEIKNNTVGNLDMEGGGDITFCRWAELRDLASVHFTDNLLEDSATITSTDGQQVDVYGFDLAKFIVAADPQGSTADFVVARNRLAPGTMTALQGFSTVVLHARSPKVNTGGLIQFFATVRIADNFAGFVSKIENAVGGSAAAVSNIYVINLRNNKIRAPRGGDSGKYSVVIENNHAGGVSALASKMLLSTANTVDVGVSTGGVATGGFSVVAIQNNSVGRMEIVGTRTPPPTSTTRFLTLDAFIFRYEKFDFANTVAAGGSIVVANNRLEALVTIDTIVRFGVFEPTSFVTAPGAGSSIVLVNNSVRGLRNQRAILATTMVTIRFFLLGELFIGGSMPLVVSGNEVELESGNVDIAIAVFDTSSPQVSAVHFVDNRISVTSVATPASAAPFAQRTVALLAAAEEFMTAPPPVVLFDSCAVELLDAASSSPSSRPGSWCSVTALQVLPIDNATHATASTLNLTFTGGISIASRLTALACNVSFIGLAAPFPAFSGDVTIRGGSGLTSSNSGSGGDSTVAVVVFDSSIDSPFAARGPSFTLTRVGVDVAAAESTPPRAPWQRLIDSSPVPLSLYRDVNARAFDMQQSSWRTTCGMVGELNSLKEASAAAATNPVANVKVAVDRTGCTATLPLTKSASLHESQSTAPPTQSKTRVPTPTRTKSRTAHRTVSASPVATVTQPRSASESRAANSSTQTPPVRYSPTSSGSAELTHSADIPLAKRFFSENSILSSAIAIGGMLSASATNAVHASRQRKLLRISSGCDVAGGRRDKPDVAASPLQLEIDPADAEFAAIRGIAAGAPLFVLCFAVVFFALAQLIASSLGRGLLKGMRMTRMPGLLLIPALILLPEVSTAIGTLLFFADLTARDSTMLSVIVGALGAIVAPSWYLVHQIRVTKRKNEIEEIPEDEQPELCPSPVYGDAGGGRGSSSASSSSSSSGSNSGSNSSGDDDEVEFDPPEKTGFLGGVLRLKGWLMDQSHVRWKETKQLEWHGIAYETTRPFVVVVYDVFLSLALGVLAGSVEGDAPGERCVLASAAAIFFFSLYLAALVCLRPVFLSRYDNWVCWANLLVAIPTSVLSFMQHLEATSTKTADVLANATTAADDDDNGDGGGGGGGGANLELGLEILSIIGAIVGFVSLISLIDVILIVHDITELIWWRWCGPRDRQQRKMLEKRERREMKRQLLQQKKQQQKKNSNSNSKSGAGKQKRRRAALVVDDAVDVTESDVPLLEMPLAAAAPTRKSRSGGAGAGARRHDPAPKQTSKFRDVTMQDL